jgi:hypothetical protein
MKTFGLSIITFFTIILPLYAADIVREDNSDLFVYVFLGFCSLIIIAQLVPAIMILLGVTKSVKKPVEA